MSAALRFGDGGAIFAVATGGVSPDGSGMTFLRQLRAAGGCLRRVNAAETVIPNDWIATPNADAGAKATGDVVHYSGAAITHISGPP